MVITVDMVIMVAMIMRVAMVMVVMVIMVVMVNMLVIVTVVVIVVMVMGQTGQAKFKFKLQFSCDEQILQILRFFNTAICTWTPAPSILGHPRQDI